MGFFTKLFGGADGIREAMRDSYMKHVHGAQERALNLGDSAHEIGLYGALGSRYRARLKHFSEVELWMELVPFLGMQEAQAVEMLAEYVVFQEMPHNARVSVLSTAINGAFESGLDDDRIMMAAAAIAQGVPWRSLLQPDVVAAVLEAPVPGKPPARPRRRKKTAR